MEGARPARADDTERIAQLCISGRGELSTQRGSALFLRREAPSTHGREDLIYRLNSPEHGVWVGTLDVHVVGYALARVERLDGGELLGVAEELYVQPGARSVGVGQALMEALVAWLVDSGCAGVDAQALPGDRKVKTFLESSGFKARLILLHRSLSG